MSFSTAASELNVTQSAISRQIKSLEDYLGFQLFRRLPRALELTDQGRRFAVPLQQAFELLHHATALVLEEQNPTVLNINVPPTIAVQWLVPRLGRFTEANPNIEIRMTTSLRPVDFDTDETDIAVRVGPTQKNQKNVPALMDLIATQRGVAVRSVPLLPDSLVAVCSPSLLKKGPPLSTPTDLRHHLLIHAGNQAKDWAFWLKAMSVEGIEVERNVSYNHYFVAIQAASEGKGVALIPEIFIENELKSGALIPLFSSKPLSAGIYYMLCRETDWQSPKIKMFREWITKEAALTEFSGK